ncbi:hypothetical protein LZ32DRAFT_669281, partial [Colletotrichum eremochloae]
QFDVEKLTRRIHQKPLCKRAFHSHFGKWIGNRTVGLHHHHHHHTHTHTHIHIYPHSSTQISLAANPGRLPLDFLPPSNLKAILVSVFLCLGLVGKVSASSLSLSCPHPFANIATIQHPSTRRGRPVTETKVIGYLFFFFKSSFTCFNTNTIGTRHCTLGHGRNDEKNRTLFNPALPRIHSKCYSLKTGREQK